MANIDKAVAFADANPGTKTVYYATTPEDVRNRLAAALPEGTFDTKALAATLSNGSTIQFVTGTMRPEQLLALPCDNTYKDELLMPNSPYNLDGVPQAVAERRFPKEG